VAAAEAARTNGTEDAGVKEEERNAPVRKEFEAENNERLSKKVDGV
jgi:hypothetical protein